MDDLISRAPAPQRLISTFDAWAIVRSPFVLPPQFS